MEAATNLAGDKKSIDRWMPTTLTVAACSLSAALSCPTVHSPQPPASPPPTAFSRVRCVTERFAPLFLSAATLCPRSHCLASRLDSTAPFDTRTSARLNQASRQVESMRTCRRAVTLGAGVLLILVAIAAAADSPVPTLTHRIGAFHHWLDEGGVSVQGYEQCYQTATRTFCLSLNHCLRLSHRLLLRLCCLH